MRVQLDNNVKPAEEKINKSHNNITNANYINNDNINKKNNKSNKNNKNTNSNNNNNNNKITITATIICESNYCVHTFSVIYNLAKESDCWLDIPHADSYIECTGVGI